MFNYDEIRCEKYNNHVFKCILKNEVEIRLVVHDDYDQEDNIYYNLYNFDDHKDNMVYTSKIISKIISIIPNDELVMELSDDDFEAEHGIPKINYVKLKPFNVGKDLYKWNSPDELREIYNLLKSPSIDNSEQYNDLESMINHNYGLIYTWGHWDDFDDYPIEYCAVFSGASI